MFDFEKVPTLIQHYDLLVVPSLCFENSPTVINLSLALVGAGTSQSVGRDSGNDRRK
jgi:hypothetical protein